ncbi:multidrug efflux SMR transporter [Helicobacter sp. MIT 11-5569]|uniref:DMT family transporter n=1 Tax=Helicobacter sp. MIT 11-5569 TaxID=1548151 RepID=UPI00051FBD67|nr:multidrug efflux SMR transporter [Helicobacter sp. MIT 11-5569]TLD82909.1 multidrug efflux SMR transporter [Helicobacter sp. MIT 11-5569]
MSWIFLLLAGAMEIFGVIMMKTYAITAKKIYLLGVAFFFVLSLGSLSLALQEIPMGMGYAIWTGIGTAGGVLVGIFFYKESRNFWKLFFIALIIVCSAGLKLVS